MTLSISPFQPSNSLNLPTSRSKRSTSQPSHSASFTSAEDSVFFTGRNALHIAAEANNYLEIQELTEGGVSPDELNEQDENGNTPLHLAALNNAILAVRVLLGKRGIDKVSENHKGRTPYELTENETIRRLLHTGKQ